MPSISQSSSEREDWCLYRIEELLAGKPNRTTNAVMTRKLPRISGSGLETGCSSTSPPRNQGKPENSPGLYRVVSVADPDICASKVFFPQEGAIQVHQSRVKLCPPEFPGGFYWYGGKGPLPKRPPKWSVL